MDRKQYFNQQPVTEGELNAGFDYAEAGDRNQIVDLGPLGVNFGLAVTAPVSGLSVDVSPGLAFDTSGKRIRLASPASVSLASGAVSTPGQERWVVVCAVHARLQQDPRTDGFGATVYFDQPESASINLVLGTPAAIGTAVAPGVPSDHVILADVLLTHGQTNVVTGNISTFRRVSNRLSDWLDGTENPADKVHQQIKRIVSSLTNTAGAARIGAAARTGATFGTSIPSGTPASQIQALLDRLELLQSFEAMSVYGDGSDGDVTIAAPTTINADRNYNNLTINAGQTLTVRGGVIRVRGTLTINLGAMIDASGQAASGFVNGTGYDSLCLNLGGGVDGGLGGDSTLTGVGGSPTVPADGIVAGGNGGNGGTSATRAGGTGTAATATTSYRLYPGQVYHPGVLQHRSGSWRYAFIRGGGGGGGGGSDAAFTDGGGGGGGGGVIIVFARNISFPTGETESIRAKGGAGGNATGSAAPGGGGGGGLVCVFYGKILNGVLASTCVAGGAAGIGGVLGAQPGGAGQLLLKQLSSVA